MREEAFVRCWSQGHQAAAETGAPRSLAEAQLLPGAPLHWLPPSTLLCAPQPLGTAALGRCCLLQQSSQGCSTCPARSLPNCPMSSSCSRAAGHDCPGRALPVGLEGALKLQPGRLRASPGPPRPRAHRLAEPGVPSVSWAGDIHGRGKRPWETGLNPQLGPMGTSRLDAHLHQTAPSIWAPGGRAREAQAVFATAAGAADPAAPSSSAGWAQPSTEPATRACRVAPRKGITDCHSKGGQEERWGDGTPGSVPGWERLGNALGCGSGE